MIVNSKVAFFISMLLGFLIWLLSPSLGGHAEPWDTENAYYLISLIVAGFITGFLGQKRFWLWPMGIYLGQCVYVVLKMFIEPAVGANFFFPVGMIFMGIYSIPSFIGSFIGVMLRKVIKV